MAIENFLINVQHKSQIIMKLSGAGWLQATAVVLKLR
jgi:hypothetical protein